MDNEMLADIVWRKGRIISGYNPDEWRMDELGYTIHRQAYRDRNSPYGWEINHIFPLSQGGSDDISNLQPLQWEANLNWMKKMKYKKTEYNNQIFIAHISSYDEHEICVHIMDNNSFLVDYKDIGIIAEVYRIDDKVVVFPSENAPDYIHKSLFGKFNNFTEAKNHIIAQCKKCNKFSEWLINDS